MGGNGASDSDERDEPAHADAQHWRALALAREAQLTSLRRRPMVRVSLRLDGRFRTLIGAVRRSRNRARRAHDRLGLAIGATAAAVGRSRRRAAMTRQIDSLGPARSQRPPASVAPITGSAGTAGSNASGTLANLASEARAATDEILCFLPNDHSPDPTWLDRLVLAIEGDVVAATPTLIHPASNGWPATEHELLVRSAGLSIELDGEGGPVAIARDAGRAMDVSAPVRTVDGAPMPCLVVRRDAYVDAGGLESASGLADDDLDVAALDLCVRMRRRGGRIVHVPSAVAYDPRPVAARRSLERPIDPGSGAWRWLVDREGPIIRSWTQPSTARSWVITTAVPSMKVAQRWGDWHFAEGLARALRALGQLATVEAHDGADSTASRSCDVHLVLRGLAPVRRSPGQRHILWVISHPERVDPSECDAADLVLVASPRFADELRRSTTTPVEVLLQATDPHRFAPQPVDPAHQHPITVVAKTREVIRPIVVDALAAGLRPSIYGSGWDGLVDPDRIVTDWVANDQLPSIYSSAGVVLNDHWATMRAWGFISNRLYDVLACGTPVISDAVEGLDEVFGGAVLTYRTAEDLGELVRCVLAHPERARARASEGRAEVLANHTFDHRARTLLELLAVHGLDSMRTDRIND